MEPGSCAGGQGWDDSYMEVIQGLPVNGRARGDKCALCRERKAFVRIVDDKGVEYWICHVCNRLIQWT